MGECHEPPKLALRTAISSVLALALDTLAALSPSRGTPMRHPRPDNLPDIVATKKGEHAIALHTHG